MMRALAFLITAGAFAAPATAQTLTPLIDARLRYETVEQDGIARDAEALTARVRSGIEAKAGDFVLLAEAEATLAMVENYNSSVNGRSAFPLIADPENIELNRLQLQYRGLSRTVITAGRQRINLDDQRFVGSVGWRQNEQTFDAVRVESAALGPVTVDVTYAWEDRTIFGIDSPISGIGGDNVFANAGVKLGPITAKGFAYLIDQDEPGRRQFSSQTYGTRLAGTVPLGAAKLSLAASYARQSSWQDNPNRYSTDYWLGEAQLGWKGLTFTGGYEVLGADDGRAFTSFQTPLATLHKFQGWADKFLTTPPDGVRDLYVGGGYALPVGLPGPLALQATWHRFESDRLNRAYGSEWDISLGVKPAKQLAALVKYANYQADGFATDTKKLWLQLEFLL
jgi:hypothetical protein